MAGRSDIKAGRAFVELLLKDGKFHEGVRSAQKTLRTFSGGVARIGSVALAAGAAITGPLMAAVKMVTDIGGDLQDMHQRTGLSVESLSELGYAADQSGSSLSVLEGAVRKYQKAIKDGKSDPFADIGLSLEQLKAMSPEQQFLAIADRISKIEDPTERAGAAMAVFGKSAGPQLLPLLADGVKGIEELRARARDLGQQMSSKDAQAAESFGDLLSDISKIAKMTAVNIGAALVPMLSDTAEEIIEVSKVSTKWIQDNRELIVTIAKVGAVLVGTGGTLLAISTAANVAATSLGVLSGAIKGVGVAATFLAAHPVVAMIAALAAGAIAVGIAYNRATSYVAQFNHAIEQGVARMDEQRAADQAALSRLKELSNANNITNDQLVEADGIIADLTERYGELGVSVDRTTGRIEGLGLAQQRVNEKMRESVAGEIEAGIAEHRQNIAELRKEMDATNDQVRWADAIPSWLGGGSKDTTSAGLFGKMANEEKKMRALEARREALLGGDANALTGGKSTTPGSSDSSDVESTEAIIKRKKELAEAEKKWATIEEEAASRRRTDLENELAGISKLADERRAVLLEMIKAEDSAERINELELERLRVGREEDEMRRKAIAKSEEAKRKERQEIQQQADSENQRLRDEIARLEIETNKSLTQKQRDERLIDLAANREIEDVMAKGGDPALVRKKAELEKLGLNQRDTRQEIVGSFSAAALSAQGQGGNGREERQIRATQDVKKAIEKTNQHFDRLERIIERGLAIA